MSKKYTISLSAIFIVVILVNALGYDDMNILIFTNNPPFWILEQLPIKFPIFVHYVFGLLFWACLGLFIDKRFGTMPD